MSTQTSSYTEGTSEPTIGRDRSVFLRRVLWGNVLFSTLCALVILLDLGPVTNFLGWPLQWPLLVVGLGLLPFALFVAYVARTKPFHKTLAWVVIEMDIAWVIASAAILMLGWPAGTTVGGKWAIGIVAEIVAAFAILQYFGLRRLGRE